MSKEAKAKRDGVINPHNYNFYQISTQKILMLSNATNQQNNEITIAPKRNNEGTITKAKRRYFALFRYDSFVIRFSIWCLRYSSFRYSAFVISLWCLR